MTALLFIIGLVLLVVGAELLVRGAARLAAALGISPLAIGLTVVAYGTSAPELAVSLIATLDGQADIALGNVVGSNIFNVLFILGVSAMVAPLVVSRQLVRLDVPVMVGVSIAMMLLSLDGRIGRIEGVLLVTAIAGYTAFLLRHSRRSGSSGAAEETRTIDDGPAPAEPAAAAGERGSNDAPGRRTKAIIGDVGLVLLGLALLVLGSRWLVDGAVAAAQALGVNELVIGLTIIAAGTSLPELATSVLATLRGERDIAVGNVIGSNIYNILAILGLSAVIADGGVAVAPAALTFDIPVMTAVAVACLPIFFTGHRIERWEGALFLGYYIAYTGYLVLSASEHAALPVYGLVMLGFVVPITAMGLGVVAWREWRGRSDR
jgi:cation:H+ antiporter